MEHKGLELEKQEQVPGNWPYYLKRIIGKADHMLIEKKLRAKGDLQVAKKVLKEDHRRIGGFTTRMKMQFKERN